MQNSYEEKEQSITQLNISNSCYVLDQQGNYAMYIVSSSLSIICVTWRWPLVAETCSYLVDLIHNNY